MIDEVEVNDKCDSCEETSDYGIVSINKNSVVHEHYCKKCYFSDKRKTKESKDS
jgi:hypothetical protein